MKASRTMVLGVSVGVLCVGCVSARATMLGTMPKQAPVPEEQVRVFLANDTVPPECQKYALLTLAGSAQSTNEAQMIAAARRRAGKIGANAVQLGEVKNPSTARVVASVLLPVSADRKGQMLAFRCPTP
jgi:Asp/Glu/hydantoin racemase